MPSKEPLFLSADDAVGLVKDGDVVSVSGCLFNLVPEQLCVALERRFLATGAPSDLTLYHLNIFGFKAGTGIDRFAHRGMTRCMIGSSFPPYPWAADSPTTRLIVQEEIEAIALPAGVIADNFRATGAGKPGFVTRVGLRTFVDPRLAGGRLNMRGRSTTSWKSPTLVTCGGSEMLHFAAQPIQVSFIHASAADTDGNVSFEDEPLLQSAVSQAMATRASGGKVIVQVQRVVPGGALDHRLVKLPSLLADVIVVEPAQAPFAYGLMPREAGFCGAARGLESPAVASPPRSPDTFIGMRAVLEIATGDRVNLGAGVPVKELPARIVARGLHDRIDLTIDHGSLGGVNVGGLLAGTHWNPTALFDSNQIYEYYAGSGLDITFLGAAEIDGKGNVNVARSGDVAPGIGGFIDIAEAAKTIVICSTLRREGLDVKVTGGQLRVASEGRKAKFVREVEFVCLCAERLAGLGKRILYVTERAVFEYRDQGPCPG
jgi:propionate CoA-transferase